MVIKYNPTAGYVNTGAWYVENEATPTPVCVKASDRVVSTTLALVVASLLAILGLISL